jgi:hypothetical protein
LFYCEQWQHHTAMRLPLLLWLLHPSPWPLQHFRTMRSTSGSTVETPRTFLVTTLALSVVAFRVYRQVCSTCTAGASVGVGGGRDAQDEINDMCRKRPPRLTMSEVFERPPRLLTLSPTKTRNRAAAQRVVLTLLILI